MVFETILYCTACMLVLWAFFLRSRRHSAFPLPPGPRGLPFIGVLGQISQQWPWLSFYSLTKGYGDVTSVHICGQTIIVFNSFDAADSLFTRRSSKYATQPFRKMAQLSGLTDTMPFMEPGPALNQARKHFHSELGSRPIQKYYDDIEQATRTLMDYFAADPGCAQLEKHLEQCTGVLFMKVAAGYVVDEHEDTVLPSIRRLVKFASNVLDVFAGDYAYLDQFPFLCSLPRWMPGTGAMHTAELWGERLRGIAAETADLVKRDLAAGAAHQSFMGNLYSRLHDTLEPDSDDEAQYRLIALTMCAGGVLPLQGTTLTFLHAMARHPAVQRRAQAELDAVLCGRSPTLADCAALPYIDAIILEVLRWVPFAPLVARRVLEDDEYMGFAIPKGSTVVANNWAMAFDPAVYPEPELFRPERFLEKPPSGAHDPRNFAFGWGRRICPGAHFSHAILFMNVASVLARFDVALAPGVPEYAPGAPVNTRTAGATCRVVSPECVLVPRVSAATMAPAE